MTTNDQDLAAGTVSEVEARANAATTVEELDRIQQAEAAGQNRVGVRTVIDRRRAELQQSPPAPGGGTATATSTAGDSSSRPAAETQDTTPTASGSPVQGAAGDPNRVASAANPTDVMSLADLAAIPQDQRNINPTVAPADQTEVKVINGHEAAATPSAATGAFGQALPPGGEVAGGNIKKTLDPPADTTALNLPLTKERAALLSPIGRAIAPFVQRPVTEWGLIGPGETIRGHMLLLDLNTGEKVRGMDGHRVNEGQIYANLRNMPESLSTGDTIDQLLAATK